MAADQVGRRSRSDEPALSEHRSVGAEFLDLDQLVAGQDDGGARGGPFHDGVVDFEDLGRVHPGGGLIENEEVGSTEEGLGQSQPVAHAVGVARHRPVDGLGQPRGFDGVVEVRRPTRQPELATGQVEVLPARQVGHEPGTVDECPDPAEHRGTRMDRLPEDGCPPRRRSHQSEQDLHGDGLAGAVRSHQTQDLAGLHGQRDVIDGRDAVAEPLGQVVDDDGRGSGVRSVGRSALDRGCRLRPHRSHHRSAPPVRLRGSWRRCPPPWPAVAWTPRHWHRNGRARRSRCRYRPRVA